jgi:hypothetical protein
MKKDDIKIGTTYTAKITNRVVPVRIDAENPHGGWDATNMATKKKVRIKSAAKLRSEYRENMKAVAAADQENARIRDERKASKDGKTASERAMSRTAKTQKAPRAKTAATPAKGKAKATTAAKTTKAATRAKSGGDKAKTRTGILDAAAQILAKAKEPMGCKDIVEQAIAKKLWSTSGKTPSATLYAAIIREISKKGKDARFEKVDRGRFQLCASKKGA